MNLKEVWLQKTTIDNVNETIYMFQNEENRFIEQISRTGSSPYNKPHSMKYWDSIYQKHINNGMKDVTTLHLVTNNIEEYTDEIEYYGLEESVKSLIKHLRSCAYKEFGLDKSNFVKTTRIKTSEMISAGRHLLNTMCKITDINSFNNLLLELFHICPFQMSNIEDYLAKKTDDITDILNFQYSRLDTMEVELLCDTQPDSSILSSWGLNIRPMTKEESFVTKSHMKDAKEHFIRAWRVHNKNTERKYNNWKNNHPNATEHFFYHGSGNSNILSIMVKGLMINADIKLGVSFTGKMFGNGLYFASKALKSIGYTSVPWRCAPGVSSERNSYESSYLFVYKVAYENPYHVHKWEKWMVNADSNPALKGYDALFAHAGVSLRNDEIIVYDSAQTTLYAIIEIK